jgi:hypothetical protein
VPTKIWAVGEEVIAADFNAMVQRQVVATFANASARDAAIPAPTEGMVAYLIDAHSLQVYRNGAWTTNPGGSVLHGGAVVADANTAVIGIVDLAPTFEQGTTFPFATRTVVNASLYGGVGSTTVNLQFDIYAYGPAVAVAATPNPIQSVPGGWIAGPICPSWNNAPYTSVGFKVRLYFLSGSNCHTGGNLSYTVFAL